MATWPPSLPALPQDWADSPNGEDGKLRTNMGNGPPKVRLRTDRAWRTFQVRNWLLTADHRDTLQAFGTTLGRFVDPFDIADPHDETLTLSVRFVGDPVYRSARGSPQRVGRAYRTGFTLEVVT